MDYLISIYSNIIVNVSDFWKDNKTIIHSFRWINVRKNVEALDTLSS